MKSQQDTKIGEGIMNEKTFQKRRQYLLDSPIQKRYLLHSVIMMIIPALFVGACLYFLIFYLVSDQIMIPEAVVQTLKPVIIKLNYILALGIPTLLILLFISAILVSHRLAGPIYRLEKDLDRIAEGDYSVRIHFRKKDKLDPLAEKINKVLGLLPKK